MLREQNYYPFGLEHKGYNSVIQGVKNNLKTYQGQEFTEDLGLNTHEWKYRISDPAIGRFWQIDPLSEDYVYNSTYAFQENKMGMGVELEGLELEPFNEENHTPLVPPVSNDLDGGGTSQEVHKFQDDNIIISPVKNPTIISEQAPSRVNPVSGVTRAHNGADLVDVDATQTAGTPVVSPANGKVELVRTSDDGNGAGNRVHIRANSGEKYSMFHLQDGTISHLSNGQEVNRGDALGNVGTTGNSTGPHLHLETRNSNNQVVNPRSVIPALRTAPVTRIARRPANPPTISSSLPGMQ
nr:peptidoglycan DD-metalloendopeptidase family protein [uncultured Lacinutrix sp.]